MNKWKLIYFEDNGISEILNFINSLSDNEQTKIFSWITILEEQ